MWSVCGHNFIIVLKLNLLKQLYRCKTCGYQYVENPISRRYPVEVKQLCLKMYLNGMGFKAISLRAPDATWGCGSATRE